MAASLSSSHRALLGARLSPRAPAAFRTLPARARVAAAATTILDVTADSYCCLVRASSGCGSQGAAHGGRRCAHPPRRCTCAIAAASPEPSALQAAPPGPLPPPGVAPGTLATRAAARQQQQLAQSAPCAAQPSARDASYASLHCSQQLADTPSPTQTKSPPGPRALLPQEWRRQAGGRVCDRAAERLQPGVHGDGCVGTLHALPACCNFGCMRALHAR